MKKEHVKKELSKLLEVEADILGKLARDTSTPDEKLRLITKKLFELSDLILRLQRVLREIRKNET